MCNTCGCPEDTGNRVTVEINQSLLKSNEDMAEKNRVHFDIKGIFVMNLISSPGAGKTSLLEKTIEELSGKISIGVLEGDIETELDAERIRAKGIPAIQLTTGGACHLESSLVHKGFHKLEHELNGKSLDILFIENVGNLVCPSFFDLGEHTRVVLISIPEGHDKPVKYPKAIQSSDILIITKTDLVPYFDFDIEKAKADALALNPSITILTVSVKTGDGIEEWTDCLIKSITLNRAQKS
ncbi:MAG: hydrogenase nickel incorporation protein HypB [Nitrospira sp.]|nr:hydrogenase nickel incorporation protein HypB [bacterium]MBL7048010.1 hydrogenase nickel incorporation protein HypB [Nitrospira sp.]